MDWITVKIKYMNYPEIIYVDTDLVGSEEPHEGWQKYQRVDDNTQNGIKVTRVTLDGKAIISYIKNK